MPVSKSIVTKFIIFLLSTWVSPIVLTFSALVFVSANPAFAINTITGKGGDAKLAAYLESRPAACWSAKRYAELVAEDGTTPSSVIIKFSQCNCTNFSKGGSGDSTDLWNCTVSADIIPKTEAKTKVVPLGSHERDHFLTQADALTDAKNMISAYVTDERHVLSYSAPSCETGYKSEWDCELEATVEVIQDVPPPEQKSLVLSATPAKPVNNTIKRTVSKPTASFAEERKKAEKSAQDELQKYIEKANAAKKAEADKVAADKAALKEMEEKARQWCMAEPSRKQYCSCGKFLSKAELAATKVCIK